MSSASVTVNPFSTPEILSEDDVSPVQQSKLAGNTQNQLPSQVDDDLIRNSGQKYASFDRYAQRDGSARSDDWSSVQASLHNQQAIDTIVGLEEVTPIGWSRAVRFPDLRAEYSLNTWLARYSLLELRKMLRASRPDKPLQQCLPPLGAPILQTTNMTLPLATHSSTERYIFKHLVISVESFLASLSLLEDLWNFTESCPSIPALYYDVILRRDQYRDSHELDIARIIMEHIDAHHASISHEVNIEIGASYIVDPLPATSDNRCRCPLQHLDMSNILRNHPYALVSEAYTRLTEVEGFNASSGLIDPLIAAKYFHSFEYRIAQIVHRSNHFNTNENVTQHDSRSFIPLRARQIRHSRNWSKL